MGNPRVRGELCSCDTWSNKKHPRRCVVLCNLFVERNEYCPIWGGMGDYVFRKGRMSFCFKGKYIPLIVNLVIWMACT